MRTAFRMCGRNIAAAILFLASAFSVPAFSQEEKGSKIDIGADFVSSYIWRGTRYGTSPALQPEMEYAGRVITAGVWGSFDFSGYQEVDTYISFALPAGISIGLTDYYSPDYKYFDFSKATGSHALEVNLGFERGIFGVSGNCVLNEAGDIGSKGADLYFEATCCLKYFTLFIGAGDGWYTFDPDTGEDRFAVCNLGIEASKNIKVTESFDIPVTGRIIFNPDKEQLFIVVGFSF